MRLSKDATLGNEISIQKGVVKKYNYQGTFEKNIENTDDEMKAWTGTPTFALDAGTGNVECANFALEYHLRIGYEPDVGTKSFKLKEAFVDIIYG